jgi:hypothetical protein
MIANYLCYGLAVALAVAQPAALGFDSWANRRSQLSAGSIVEARIFDGNAVLDLDAITDAECWSAVNASTMQTTVPRTSLLAIKNDEELVVERLANPTMSATSYRNQAIYVFAMSRAVKSPDMTTVRQHVTISRAPLGMSTNGVGYLHLGVLDAITSGGELVDRDADERRAKFVTTTGSAESTEEVMLDDLDRPTRWTRSVSGRVMSIMLWRYEKDSLWPSTCAALTLPAGDTPNLAKYELTPVRPLAATVTSLAQLEAVTVVVTDKRADVVQAFELRAPSVSPLTLEEVLKASEANLAAGAARRVVPPAAERSWTGAAAIAAAAVAAVSLVLVLRRMQTRPAR